MPLNEEPHVLVQATYLSSTPRMCGREEIGIDADRYDRTLRRQGARVLESVHHNDRPGWIAAGCGSQHLKLAQKIIRIVGKPLHSLRVQGRRVTVV